MDAGNGIELDAVKMANFLDYDGVLVPVIRPKHLVVIYAKVGGNARIARALDILEGVNLDLELIASLVERYNLRVEWQKLLARK